MVNLTFTRRIHFIWLLGERTHFGTRIGFCVKDRHVNQRILRDRVNKIDKRKLHGQILVLVKD